MSRGMISRKKFNNSNKLQNIKTNSVFKFYNKEEKDFNENEKLKTRNLPLKEYKDSEITSINNVGSIPNKLNERSIENTSQLNKNITTNNITNNNANDDFNDDNNNSIIVRKKLLIFFKYSQKMKSNKFSTNTHL